MTTTVDITGYYQEHYTLPANTNLDVFSTGGVSEGVSTASDVRIVNDGRLNGTGYGNAQYNGIEFTDGGDLINGNYAYAGALVEGRAGVLLAGGLGTVTNFGTIRSTAAIFSSPDGGVDLFSGGSVTNGAAGERTALISGEWGVFTENAAATVANFGTILGLRPGSYAAVQMTAGGTVTNGSAGDFTSLLRGGEGVNIKGAGGVANFGAIVGSVQQGVVLYNGGNVTNGAVTDAGASISGVLQGVGLVFAGTVANFGVISGSGGAHGDTGVELNSGGRLTNGATSDLSATISGYTGVLMGGPATVVNYGAITGLGASPTEFGVDLADGGTVTNGSASEPTAHIQGGVGVELRGATGGGVANFGAIVGSVQQGVVLYDVGNVTNGAVTDSEASISGVQQGVGLVFSGTVTNFGAISGTGAAHGDTGVQLNSGGQLTNGAGGDLSASIVGYTGALMTGAGTVTNYGTVSGVGASEYEHGIYLVDGGHVTNGTTQDKTALVQGGTGVAIANASGVVANYGTILAHSSGNQFATVEMRAGGLVINGTAGDVAALIQGGAGVRIQGGYGFVDNSGTIAGSSEPGVALYGGGNVFNGAATDTRASISGGQFAVELYDSGTVTNFGSILGSGVYQGTAGVDMAAGGSLVNGSTRDLGATIAGYGGVQMNGAGTVTNYGTINGLGASVSAYGVDLAAGGTVINGAGTSRTATIEGGGGVVISGAAGTVRNSGTILGSANAFAVELAAGGSVTNGALNNPGALIQGYAGLYMKGGFATNLGTISGVSDYGFGVRLAAGAAITNGAAGHTGAVIEGYEGVYAVQAATVTNFGTIAGAGAKSVYFQSPLDVLNVEAGSTFEGAVYGGGGTLDLASGTGTLSGLLSSGGNLTVSGSMATTTFQNFGTVEVGSGATFTDTGAVAIAAGQVVNDAGILALGGAGAASIVNAGLIETTGAGNLTLAGAVTSTGTIAANGGILTVIGAVTGTGKATVTGGTLDLTSGFTENVTFSGSGVLELAKSQTYTGSITGFSKTASTSLDLADIGFVSSTEATFSGTKTGGVLTVTDGTHTAHINLKGNYLTSTWIASSDGHGGTTVVDPAKGKATASPALQFIAAMAGMGAMGGVIESGTAYGAKTQAMLFAPRSSAA